jgi:bifunctional non-homologous end joining protein LigD
LEKIDSESVRLVPSIYGEDRKRTFFGALRTMNAEGAVFKLASAVYAAGRPSSGGPALKFKFTTTGSFIVAEHNTTRSVGLKLFRQKHLCGNVTIPPNLPIPKIGEIVEVRYLYAFRGGSLYQPV